MIATLYFRLVFTNTLILCGIEELTMFTDYHVPQILHHLHLLTYAPVLVRKLHVRELKY